jgi:acetoin utilization deacetylase AcuC-like enzyme
VSTGLYTHADCFKHNMGSFHPECPDRLSAIEDALISSGVGEALTRLEAPLATAEQLLRAHTPGHVHRLAQLAALERDYIALDPDTILAKHSYAAALRAAGACVGAVDAVMAGELQNAFCAVRPPGHHAMRDKPMGFCFFSNVAVAAKHALAVHGIKRVLVVDFDVHHGNGTEDVLASDCDAGRVLMTSIFQHPFYPYSGDHAKAANMINLPVAAYTRGPAVRELITQQWLPAIAAFKPELVLISAGFDAHRDDDLGQLGLIEADYAWMTEQLMRVAREHAQGRIVSSLEGGYNLQALARSVVAHVRTLTGV